MAKYKILVIAHALKNNVVAEFGDEVDETQLTTNAADLINQGFIKKVDGSDIVQEVEEVEEEDPIEEEEEEVDDSEKEEDAPAPEISKKDEIKSKFQQKK